MKTENVRITIVVPYDRLRMIKKFAGAEGICASALIREMIEEGLIKRGVLKIG